MTEPKIVISGVELTPEEFVKSRKKLVIGGEPWSDGDYFKRVALIKEVIKSGLLDEKQDPAKEIESLRSLVRFYQQIYRDKREEEQIFLEFKNFLIANKDILKKAIKDDALPPEKPAQKHGKSGRHSYQEDIWAWEQIYTENRPKNEVYPEWIAKIKDNPERCNMVLTQDQWKRITKPEWRKGKIGKNI